MEERGLGRGRQRRRGKKRQGTLEEMVVAVVEKMAMIEVVEKKVKKEVAVEGMVMIEVAVEVAVEVVEEKKKEKRQGMAAVVERM